jgi:hypothetical protein
MRRLTRTPVVLLLLVAALSFGGAFAVARAARGGGDGPSRATPVYYGPPPVIPNLRQAAHSPAGLAGGSR